MTTINPVTTTQTQTTAFKGKNSFAKSILEKLSKKETIPMKIIDEINSPISRAVREGRPKEEIKEMVIRDTLAKISGKYADAFAKLAAKNGYKK